MLKTTHIISNFFLANILVFFFSLKKIHSYLCGLKYCLRTFGTLSKGYCASHMVFKNSIQISTQNWQQSQINNIYRYKMFSVASNRYIFHIYYLIVLTQISKFCLVVMKVVINMWLMNYSYKLVISLFKDNWVCFYTVRSKCCLTEYFFFFSIRMNRYLWCQFYSYSYN